MPTLRDTQTRLADAILGGDLAPAATLVRHDRLPPEARLQIYRNHTFTSLATALGDNFPVTRRLVGDDFFRAAARQFIGTQPPADPCLSAYGADFPDFLAAFGPARSLPYLPDTARLEWARLEVTFAADMPPLDLAALARRSDADQGGLRLALRPTVRLLASPHPVDRIWLAHQRPEVHAVDLDAGPARLLIARNLDGCRIEPLDTGRFAFFQAAAAGSSLEAAAAQAHAADRGFDLVEALATHRALGVLADTIGAD